MNQKEATRKERLGRHMSFLSHLDELRRRLTYCVIIVGIAVVFCWNFKSTIYNFLAVPVRKALAEAQRETAPLQGLNGEKTLLSLSQLKEGDRGRYAFGARKKALGNSALAPGTSVLAVVAKDSKGNIGLYTEEPIYTDNGVIPEGIKLPVKLLRKPDTNNLYTEERLVFTTPMEPFQLYLMVSIYAGIALSVPFLLFQIWGFISPALYKHERKYVTPFIGLSSISFIMGAAFAYYIIFPSAVGYLLGLGEDFTPLLKANDYFDLITLIMLAMGAVFQMPAVSYVLSRIGIITAGFLVKSWKIALIVILIVAAFVSPTPDAINMMLFATPMIALYVVSIGVTWLFGKKRKPDEI